MLRNFLKDFSCSPPSFLPLPVTLLIPPFSISPPPRLTLHNSGLTFFGHRSQMRTHCLTLHDSFNSGQYLSTLLLMRCQCVWSRRSQTERPALFHVCVIIFLTSVIRGLTARVSRIGSSLPATGQALIAFKYLWSAVMFEE